MGECLSCVYVNQKCALTSPEKVVVHFVCEHYQEVRSPAEVQARHDIVTRYGETGIKALLFADNTTKGE